MYSQTLGATHTAHTELVREFDPTEIRVLKQASDKDLTIDGPTLAAEAFRHDLIDRVILLMCPVTVGAGLPFWPPRRLNLGLRQMQRFDADVVYLNYDVVTEAPEPR